MAERKYEEQLNIRTTGLREWRNHPHYKRYEATPYKALDELFKVYRFEDSDEVVDFGCGRGRVSFYIHHKFGIPVTGVEVNDLTLDEALDNKKSYRYIANHIEAPLRFDFALAEQYDIDDTANTFYFFNPFSVEIFKQVVGNILKSVERKSRPVDIILYYPTPQYQLFMKNHTDFKLVNRVRVPGAQDKLEMFLIYRLA